MHRIHTLIPNRFILIQATRIIQAIWLRIKSIPPGHTLYHPRRLPPTHTIAGTRQGTLRGMSKPTRNTIKIATKKESRAVIRKVTKPAKAGRPLKINFGKSFSRKPQGAEPLVDAIEVYHRNLAGSRIWKNPVKKSLTGVWLLGSVACSYRFATAWNAASVACIIRGVDRDGAIFSPEYVAL